MSGREAGLVPVLAEVKHQPHLGGSFRPVMQQRRSSARTGNRGLEPLVDQLAQKAERAYEVALTGAVRADQHVELAERQVHFTDGLDALELDPVERHR